MGSVPKVSLARSTDVSLFPFLARGELWYGGSGKITIPSSQSLRMTLANDGESDKSIVIQNVRGYASGPSFIEVYESPNAGLPVVDQLVSSSIWGKPYEGLTKFKADTGATPLSGGVKHSFVAGFGSGSETTIPGPLLINPGGVIGLNVTASGSTTMYLNIVWIETVQIGLLFA